MAQAIGILIQRKIGTILSYLHSQYHDCWWPGDMRSQGIMSHGIDLVLPEYSNLCTRRVEWIYSLLEADYSV